MKRKRHTPEEIIKKLRAAEEALAGGKPVEEACRVISVSMAIYQRWKSQYGGLKKLVADQALDMAILKSTLQGGFFAYCLSNFCGGRSNTGLSGTGKSGFTAKFQREFDRPVKRVHGSYPATRKNRAFRSIL
jgi:putative transposase